MVVWALWVGGLTFFYVIALLFRAAVLRVKNFCHILKDCKSQSFEWLKGIFNTSNCSFLYQFPHFRRNCGSCHDRHSLYTARHKTKWPVGPGQVRIHSTQNEDKRWNDNRKDIRKLERQMLSWYKR
jgi:hypothetical protein